MPTCAIAQEVDCGVALEFASGKIGSLGEANFFLNDLLGLFIDQSDEDIKMN